MTGWRDKETGLWRFPLRQDICNPNVDTGVLPKAATQAIVDEIATNVHDIPSTEQVVRYLHAAAGFPTKATWVDAIKRGFYSSWPMLNARIASKYFPESEETQKGHMRQKRSGVRKTHRRIEFIMDGTEQEIQDINIDILELRRKQKDILLRVYKCTESLYTDQTGRFPFNSSRGFKYIMVACEIDSNQILVEPMKSRTETSIIRAHKAIIQRLKATNIHPKIQYLDNEASEAYKRAIQECGMTYQLITPHVHRANVAEKAIQTFKNHFTSILAGTDASFPMHLWDRLLPQAEMTLNMLRASNATPTVSAYMYAHGTHDYNAHPLAPLGCSVQLFETPETRRSWDAHSVDGWYIGTSMEHYRNYVVFCKKSKMERVSDTVWFRHKYLTNPSVTLADHIVDAATNLTNTLKGHLPRQVDTSTKSALAKLASIFTKAAIRYSNREAGMTAQLPGVGSGRNNEQKRKSANPGVPNGERATRTRTNALRRIDETATPGVPVSEGTRHRSSRRPDVRDVTREAILSALEVNTVPLTARQLATKKYPLAILCEIAGAVLDPKTGELMEYRHLMKKPEYREVWSRASAKEIGRLAQGIPGLVEGTDTFYFVNYEQIPNDRKKDVTYARICVNFRPEKEDPNRVRVTVGGDRINYPFEVQTPTADMLLVKLLFNSIISTTGSKFMSLDIKNFYLMTPMKRYEYMRMKLSDIPQQVVEHYELNKKASKDGYVFVEIRRGMYGLPQAGLIAQELLEKRLNARGYYQSTYTPGLWMHKTRSTKIALVVDDFGVKYDNDEDAQHLIDSLTPFYEITIDREGKRFIGLTMDWDYENREVHLSMPGYVEKALKRFGHKPPAKPQHQPHPHQKITYGAKTQHSLPEDTSPALDKKQKKFVQEVTGVFLYYARAVDSTMLVALSAIAAEQGAPTQNTLRKVEQFLDYAATHPDAVVTYKASDMKLAIHSDASYLSEPKARSRAGGHYFLSQEGTNPPNNGAVLNISKVIKAVMSSAAEAELGALFINAKTAVPMRKTLEELGHPQPPTPVHTDNSTAYGVINNKILPKATKAMDMRFYWLKDRESVEQFKYYWSPGKENRADYWTKHHPALHHQTMRTQILNDPRAVKIIAEALKRRAMTANAA